MAGPFEDRYLEIIEIYRLFKDNPRKVENFMEELEEQLFSLSGESIDVWDLPKILINSTGRKTQKVLRKNRELFSETEKLKKLLDAADKMPEFSAYINRDPQKREVMTYMRNVGVLSEKNKERWVKKTKDLDELFSEYNQLRAGLLQFWAGIISIAIALTAIFSGPIF